ncbi:MAG: TauD/TfdA family dioxygenase [Alphaproteobacteria bacterium]|nr:TauD/TfdA family dioxygenase [Alphaproteobacteria bacterium]
MQATIDPVHARGQPTRHRLIDEPAAWLGRDLAKRPDLWIERLSDDDNAEIAAAVAATQVRGVPIEKIGREDFPLPTLGSRLDALRKEVVHGRGFVLLRGLAIADRPIEYAAAAYWGVGTYFGRARSQNSKGHLLGHVRSQGLSTADPNVRSYQTTERQTFHIDSCDIVGLLCVRPAKRGGESKIASSISIYNRMVEERPDLVDRLFLPMFNDRRGEVPVGAEPWFVIPVFNEYLGYLSVFYIRQYVMSAQRFPEVPRLSPADVEALDYFDRLCDDPAMRLDMTLESGDMQFLHNHTVVHDRNAYEDWPERERKRHLLRLWIAAPDARPLPAAYAQRFGSVTIGDRGGILCKDTCLHVDLA